VTNRILRKLVAVGLLAAAAVPSLYAQQSREKENQDANTQAYVALLMGDVSTSRTEIITTVMDLTSEEAAVFWPIYKEFDAELSKLGEQKLDVIRDYAEHYGSITDDKANQIVTRLFDLKDKRDALLKKTYGRVRAKMGGITAARFVQVENQILLLMDLQTSSKLPAVQ